jgi:hypothetical protein
MTKRDKQTKARNDGKSGVPFSSQGEAWPPIVVGAVDPLRMGTVQ